VNPNTRPADRKRLLWALLPIGATMLFGVYLLPWYRVLAPGATYTGWRLLVEVMWSDFPDPTLQTLFDVAMLWPLVGAAAALFHWTWAKPSRIWVRLVALLGMVLLTATRIWFGDLEVKILFGWGVAMIGYACVLGGTWGKGRTR